MITGGLLSQKEKLVSEMTVTPERRVGLLAVAPSSGRKSALGRND